MVIEREVVAMFAFCFICLLSLACTIFMYVYTKDGLAGTVHLVYQIIQVTLAALYFQPWQGLAQLLA